MKSNLRLGIRHQQDLSGHRAIERHNPWNAIENTTKLQIKTMTGKSVSFLKLNPEKFDNSAFYAASEQKSVNFLLWLPNQ